MGTQSKRYVQSFKVTRIKTNPDLAWKCWQIACRSILHHTSLWEKRCLVLGRTNPLDRESTQTLPWDLSCPKTRHHFINASYTLFRHSVIKSKHCRSKILMKRRLENQKVHTLSALIVYLYTFVYVWLLMSAFRGKKRPFTKKEIGKWESE